MIYIYGAGGHAKVVAEILELRGLAIAGFIDVNSKTDTLLGYPVYDESLSLIGSSPQLIIGVGSNIIRKRISESLTGTFISAIHPSANISTRSQIETGTAVMPGASINSDVIVGRHCIINTNCSIDHDCVLGAYVHVSPGVALAGNVTVGNGVHIGIGSSIIQGIKIGKWATIGAGAVIIKDVPDYAVVVGNPGKIIKYNKIDEQ
ncbi:acetyltransferase [Mucilaginibacter ximonensis]|uniref:Acetyltransferase n=1 Tax=Mucilaginibacter ximonensis TaxID=538021 RepID=A0ABW5YB74_9SPHI